jgi:hypothetical protein
MKDHVILEDRCRHGHLTAGLMMRLKCSVSNYIAKNEWFYIGITNRPYRRSIEHEWRNHERMILLYRTTSESYVRSLERDFVNLYRTDPKYNEKMANAQVVAVALMGKACIICTYCYRLRNWK